MRPVSASLRRSLLAASVLLPWGVAEADPHFNGIAAGDMTSSDAILWTRVDNGGATTSLTAQVATDPSFTEIVWTATGSTVQANDYTLKLGAAGLASNTRYYYRFSANGATSLTGQFMTTPSATQNTGYKVGFSGDTDGRFRPYPSVAGFGTAANPGSQGLNSFIFLGDTMYETASTGSPPAPNLTPSSSAEAAQAALRAYNHKYLENIGGVDSATGAIDTASGQQGLQGFLASVGIYTLLDNHELGNRALQTGGAPPAAPYVNTNPAYDVNTTGAYDNQTVAFQTIEKSFFNYHPTAANIDGTPTGGLSITNQQLPTNTVQAPADPRANGTAQNYFSRSWGKSVTYIQLDDRSYRDARLDVVDNGDTAGNARADSPNRTMLGPTQLAWFQGQVDAAGAAGKDWVVISVSTPIDQTGSNQDSKSWFGNYRAERNALLKYIVDSGLQHVVFLTTDDHEMRVTRLQYEPDPAGHPGQFALIAGAFQVLTGPIGGGGPDAITDHSYRNIVGLLSAQNTVVDNNPDLIAHGDPAIGLVGMQGLSNVYRQGDPNAATNPSSIDFFAPDKFGYTTLAWDASGNLRVETWGIDSYAANTFPQTSPTPQLIFAFEIKIR